MRPWAELRQIGLYSKLVVYPPLSAGVHSLSPPGFDLNSGSGLGLGEDDVDFDGLRNDGLWSAGCSPEEVRPIVCSRCSIGRLVSSGFVPYRVDSSRVVSCCRPVRPVSAG